MKKLLLLLLLTFLFLVPSGAQKLSLLVLGDLHYDLAEDHDMEWLAKKPDDLRQVTQEYTVYTGKYWDDFMGILRSRISVSKPPVKAVIQLGDLSEGLAGSPEKAIQMASHAIKAIDEAGMKVPWVLVKGNHDITGPGAVEAFNSVYLPVIRKYAGDPNIKSGNYSVTFNNVQITCVDPWDRETDVVEFLEKELSLSKAAVKLIAIHEPVIPVTERCWHIFRDDPQKREKLLEVIAKNRAVVLCAHLHRYSVVRRETKYGPVVQVMAVSVVRDSSYLKPAKVITEYGSSLAENVPDWQPETMEKRKAMLAEEARYVTFYRQSDLPGYALLSINPEDQSIKMEYFAAFGRKPYESTDISGLLEK